MNRFSSLLRFVTFSCIVIYASALINICLPLNTIDKNNASLEELLLETKNLIGGKIAENNDTVNIGHVDLDFTHPALRLNGTMDNVKLYNLLDYKICLLSDIDLTGLTATLFNLTFNNLTFTGDYNFRGNIGDLFDIFGTGDFWLQMKEFSIAMTNFTVALNNSEICFPVNIEVYLAEMNNHFANLMNDKELEDLLNKAFYTIGPESLTIVWSEIKDIIEGPLEDIINAILRHPNVPTIFSRVLSNSKSNKSLPFCFTSDDINAI